MGCDIHISYQKVGKKKKRDDLISDLLEVEKSNLDTDWEDINDGTPVGSYGNQFCDEDRNYRWFGRMSEVRGDGPRITHEGLPDDYVWYGYGSKHGNMSPEGMYGVDSYGDGDDEYGPHDDNHSHSHIYLNELVEQEWTIDDKSNFGNFIDEDIHRMTKYCDERNIKYNEFRLLMSYDS